MADIIDLKDATRRETTSAALGRSIYEALLYGAENNKYAKPDPDKEGRMELYLAHCCNEAPLQYFQLLHKLFAADEQP